MLSAGQRAGVLTISKQSRTLAHIVAFGSRAKTAIAKLSQKGAFAEKQLIKAKTSLSTLDNDRSNRIKMH